MWMKTMGAKLPLPHSPLPFRYGNVFRSRSLSSRRHERNWRSSYWFVRCEQKNAIFIHSNLLCKKMENLNTRISACLIEFLFHLFCMNFYEATTHSPQTEHTAAQSWSIFRCCPDVYISFQPTNQSDASKQPSTLFFASIRMSAAFEWTQTGAKQHSEWNNRARGPRIRKLSKPQVGMN